MGIGEAKMKQSAKKALHTKARNRWWELYFTASFVYDYRFGPPITENKGKPIRKVQPTADMIEDLGNKMIRFSKQVRKLPEL